MIIYHHYFTNIDICIQVWNIILKYQLKTCVRVTNNKDHRSCKQLPRITGK